MLFIFSRYNTLAEGGSANVEDGTPYAAKAAKKYNKWAVRIFKGVQPDETDLSKDDLRVFKQAYMLAVDDMVDNLTALMEPMIMAVLGVLVGGLIIAMYLPIFQMGQVV